MKSLSDSENNDNPSLKQIFTTLKKYISTQEKQNAILLDKVNKVNCEINKLKTKLNDISFLKEEIQIIKYKLSLTEIELKDSTAQTETKSNLQQQIQEKNFVEEQPHDELIIDKLHSTRVYCLIETEDKRIVSGGEDGSISICSLELNKRKWTMDIHKEQAHFSWVISLCTLNKNTLISASYDYLIKIWHVYKTDIGLIKQISEHTSFVWNVISLTKERFASCSFDHSIRIWKNNSDYGNLAKMTTEDFVCSILQLKNQDILVSGCYSPSKGISFWNINNYVEIKKITGYGIYWSFHMIELYNGNIAFSSNAEPFPIVIIDTASYLINTIINLRQYIIRPSSLYVLNKKFFIYVQNGIIIKISYETFSISVESHKEKFEGYHGIISINENKFLVITRNDGLSIIRNTFSH